MIKVLLSLFFMTSLLYATENIKTKIDENLSNNSSYEISEDITKVDEDAINDSKENNVDMKIRHAFEEYDTEEEKKELYFHLQIQDFISYEAFRKALIEAKRIYSSDEENALENILTVVDFTKASTEKRMCIIDMKNKKVLLSTYCAHGKNSGDIFANKFSNKNGTYKSSPGLFLTAKQYHGRNGNSLQLIGLDKGVNDNALRRTLVIHGADYAEEQFIDKYGRLGRSLGCFAVPRKINDTVIDLIKNGTIYYVYANVKSYE